MHVCLHRILQLGAASSKEQRQPLFSLDTPGHADGILLSFSARQLDFRQRLPRDPLCPCFSESLSSSCSSVSSSYVDFGFGFDDEEGVGIGAAGGAEFLAGFVEGVGEDGEDDFALGAADEIEAAFLLDEL